MEINSRGCFSTGLRADVMRVSVHSNYTNSSNCCAWPWLLSVTSRVLLLCLCLLLHPPGPTSPLSPAARSGHALGGVLCPLTSLSAHTGGDTQVHLPRQVTPTGWHVPVTYHVSQCHMSQCHMSQCHMSQCHVSHVTGSPMIRMHIL